MAEKTQVQIEVQNQAALKALEVFQNKLLNLGKTGNKAGQDLAKGLQKGLSGLNSKIASDFTRDFNKNIRETAKGSGDTFAKDFGRSLRQSLQPQLTQLRGDVERATKGISGSVSVPSVGGGGSGFSSFSAGLIGLNQGLELAQKGFSALQSIAATTIETLNRGQEVVNLSTAFDNLQASIGRGPDTLNRFRESTKGLISDLDLFRSANQAVILGVDKGEESFFQLTEAALKLGRAMGIDAKQSIDSLVIGIGRQSKLVLDNLGVIVNAEKAHDDYAISIGKTAEALTDAEKKTAFYNAAVQAITQSSALLPDITNNAADAFSQLANQAENAFNQFAQGVAENENLASAFSSLGDSLKDIDFKEIGDSAAEVIAVLVELTNTITNFLSPAVTGLSGLIQNLKQAGNIAKLQKELQDSGLSAADALSGARAKVGEFEAGLAQTTAEVSDFKKELKDIKTPEGVGEFILKLKDLKQLAENESGGPVGKIFAADKVKEINSAIGQASAKLVGFAKQGAEAGKSTSSGLGKAEKAAQKFKDQLEDGITKLKLLGGTDKSVDGLTLAAKGLGIELFNGRVSAEELQRAVTEMAQQGIKENLSVQDIVTKVTEAYKDQAEQAEEARRAALQLEGQFQRIVEDFSQTGTGRLFDSIGSVLGEDLKREFVDGFRNAEGTPDPVGLAEAIGFNNQLESVIAQVVSNGLNGGLKDFGSGDFGASAGGAVGGLLGSYFGPIGAAIGEALGADLGKRIEVGIDEFGDSTDGTIKALTTAVDTIFFGLGTAIEKGIEGIFGFGDSAASKARKGLVSLLKNLNEETRGFGFLDQGLEGLKPDLLASLAIPDSVLQSYRELGNAFASLPEFEELISGLGGIGDQFGEILALNFENIGGLNDLQLILEGAGLSAEKFGQSLEDAYFKGTLEASAFLAQNAAINDLFAVGIPGAIGAADIAFQNFATNGRRSGQEAQDAIKDIVAEAKEFAAANGINIASVQDLASILVNNLGQDLGQVTQYFAELGNIGLDTIDEISNISVIDTAQLVNNLQAAGFAFGDITDDVNDTIAKIEEFRKSATQEVVTDWKIRVNVEGDAVPESVASQTGFKSIAGPSLR